MVIHTQWQGILEILHISVIKINAKYISLTFEKKYTNKLNNCLSVFLKEVLWLHIDYTVRHYIL